MYTLTLTQEERAAFDWVGSRYATGHNIFSVLIQCMREDQAWDDEGDITFNIPEYEAWEIKDYAEQEQMLFPCFSEALAFKMLDFVCTIV